MKSILGNELSIHLSTIRMLVIGVLTPKYYDYALFIIRNQTIQSCKHSPSYLAFRGHLRIPLTKDN